MSAADRPWWATDDADLPRGGEDPLDAHRAARRGTPEGDRSGDGGVDGSAAGHDDGSWWVPATEAVTRLARDLARAASSPPHGLVDDRRPPSEESARHEGVDEPGPSGRRTGDGPDGGSGDDGTGGGHRIDACGVCPICVGLRALGEARPELVGHLAEAARQLALAVRTVVDASAPAEDPADAADGRDPSDVPRRRPPQRDDTLRRIELDD